MASPYLNKDIIKTIIDKQGSPVYIYNQDKIEQNYLRIFSAFKKYYNDFQICYAIKANNNLAILKILSKLGAGFDCSSKGDIYLTNKTSSKFNIYTGNNCTEEELAYAIEHKVLVNLDDISLLDKLESVPERVMFRMKYSEKNSFVTSLKKWVFSLHKLLSDIIKGKSFSMIVLDTKFSKFGISRENIFEAYNLAKEKGAKDFGIHIMGDSNVLDPTHFKNLTEKIMKIIAELKKKQGITINYLDIGGGFGINYSSGGNDIDIEETAKGISDVIHRSCKRYGLKKPKLIIEPGRYIVGSAGYLAGKVQAIKNAKTKFVGTDLPASLSFISLCSENRISILNKENVSSKEKVNLCGQLCWPFDIIRKDIALPKISLGDVVVVKDMGAYGYCLGDQFNSRERPAEILVKQNKPYRIRKRESIEEFDKLVNIPSHLS